ncbi:hypothetical protein Arad_14058 (plasmid) [Rhizobium rhizogenes K84]|uniref:Uncharacterized protein n=1 Tax=Rhizobium rhizogenes (strain K84 / ATCC BAA-868) TaxID=311403 RepID=B9JP84_RHIR8|nr:hypothetical protein Arad_14058 [Rhizobium rhizogenes K84]
MVQTATKPKDRTAKGLIPDAEAGKDVMQNARQARACKLVHADVTAAPRRQNGSPICPIRLSDTLICLRRLSTIDAHLALRPTNITRERNTADERS